MNLQEQFEAATIRTRTLAHRPDNARLLKLYGLYKQASAGDISGPRPGLTAMVERAKWDAWHAQKGLSRDEAMQRYIELADATATNAEGD